MRGKEKIIKWDGMADFVNLFDEQFSISDFRTSVEQAEKRSESILGSAREAIKRAFEKDEAELKYVLDLSKDVKTALENGEVHLDRGKNGEIYAQLRCSNGRYGNKISVKEELQNENITFDELEFAMRMDVIKEQLENIIKSIKQIEIKVEEIVQGQRNDRIGLFYSGLSMYLESRTISDEYLKKQLLAQSIKTINDSYHQVIQDMRESMAYLMTEKYREEPKRMSENVENRLEIIRQCYDVVYRSTFLKATIYQEIGEIQAMLVTLNEYSRFVEKLITPYVGKLSELDRNSRFIGSSVWGQMAATLNGCNQLVQKLTSDEVHYLNLGELKNE